VAAPMPEMTEHCRWGGRHAPSTTPTKRWFIWEWNSPAPCPP